MKEEMRCPVCDKEIIVNCRIKRSGVLKGNKIVDIWKHKNCKKYFELVLLANNIDEEIEEFKKRIGIK